MEATLEYKEGDRIYTIRTIKDGEVEACENMPGGMVKGGLNSPNFERVLDKVSKNHPEVYEIVMEHIRERHGWTTEYIKDYCQRRILDRSG